jgi:hypothetical protein
VILPQNQTLAGYVVATVNRRSADEIHDYLRDRLPGYMDAGAGDVQAGDRVEVAAGADGEFLLAVQDAQVGVFDDDGDELAGVAGVRA